RRPRAGVVRDQAPALGRAVIDVRGDHPCNGWATRRDDFDALQDVVHRTRDRHDLARTLRPGPDGAPLAEHRLESRADGGRTHHARTARVDADDLVLVGPARHEPLDVPALEGIVESGFDVVGVAFEAGGLDFGLAHAGRPW